MGRMALGAILLLCAACSSVKGATIPAEPIPPHLHLRHARVFLAAADYRRAIQACLEEIRLHPSVESYVYLTYVYHALDAYLDDLAKQDQWVGVEQLTLSLAGDRPEQLLDPPDILARVAKELIHTSVQKQADITAAMASRLNETEVRRLWEEQTVWRRSHPQDWWRFSPGAWRWDGS
ncbi:MAG: hypothetical protein NW703_07250 [Nitrospiraceae bacterium]